jgi:hypothetical protein
LGRDGVGEFYCVGIFAAAKMTHLSRDKTATKMGHPIVVTWLDVGHATNREGRGKGESKGNGERRGRKVTANAKVRGGDGEGAVSAGV